MDNGKRIMDNEKCKLNDYPLSIIHYPFSATYLRKLARNPLLALIFPAFLCKI